MESRGRRVARAAGPIETPPEISLKPPYVNGMHAEVATPPEAAEPFEAPGSAVPESSGAFAAASRPAVEETGDVRRDVLAALAQSQAALARGLDALSAEVAGLALSGIDTAARAAGKMLGIKTLSDAIEVNAGFACSSFDALIGSSARFSELAIKLTAETSQPLLGQLGKAWSEPFHWVS